MGPRRRGPDPLPDSARSSAAGEAGPANDRIEGGRDRGRRAQLVAVARLGGLGLFVVVSFLVAASVVGLSSEGVRDAVDGVGPLAPLAFVVVSAGLTVACVPGPLLAGAAGLLFGTALGTPAAIVSATLGATAAAFVARRFGAAAVDELSGRRVSALQEWIAGRGFLAVLYARILPGVPYSLVNYAAGLTRIPLPVFALATAIGCAPRAFAYVALGGSLDDLGSTEAIVAFAVLVGMAFAGLLFALRDVRAARRARA